MWVEIKTNDAGRPASVCDDFAVGGDGDGTTADGGIVHRGGGTENRAACVKGAGPREEFQILRRLLPLVADDDDDISTQFCVMAEKFGEIEIVADGTAVFDTVDFEQVGLVARLDSLFQFGHDEMVFRVGGDGGFARLEHAELVAEDAFFILCHETRHDDGTDAVRFLLKCLDVCYARTTEDAEHFFQIPIAGYIGVFRKDDKIDGACGNGGETAGLPV